MSKVITFSRHFPAYHPKAGQPTYFKEKFLHSLLSQNIIDFGSKYVANVELNLNAFCNGTKNHTIREGVHWKAGDKFSPRVWGDDINPKTGKSGPYQSKQIIIAPDIEIKKVWDIELLWDHDVDEVDIRIDGKWWCQLGSVASEKLAKNDGLTIQEMKDWFRINKSNLFTGQIICWNENINY